MLRARLERGRAVCSDPAMYRQATGLAYRYEPERCVRVRDRDRDGDRDGVRDGERRPKTGDRAAAAAVEGKRERARNLRMLVREALLERIAAEAGGGDASMPERYERAYLGRNLAPLVGAAMLTRADPEKMRASFARMDAAFDNGSLTIRGDGRSDQGRAARRASLHELALSLVLSLNDAVEAARPRGRRPPPAPPRRPR